MRRLIQVLVLVLVALAGVGLVYGRPAGWFGGIVPATTVPVAAKATPVKASGLVVAEAKVVPARYAAVGAQSGGLVTQVLVAEGDQVTQGQVLLRLDARDLELQLAQAEAGVAGAEARLAQLKRGATGEDLAAAQQNLVSVKATHDHLLNPSADEVTVLRNDADKAKVVVDQAQAAYNRIGGDTNPAAGASIQGQNLQIATLDYQRALAAVNLKTRPLPSQVEQSLAAVKSAESQLARLKPASEDVAAAQASLDAARAARDLAAERAGRMRVTAPFTGTVAALDARAGEMVGAGVPLIRLADLSVLQVETTDLTELAVGRVREGDAVTITLDSLPGAEFPGKVARIRAYGENRLGDIVYTVVVRPDKQDGRWRWNMTAAVTVRPR
jgi:multidrug resistance efflux pump